MELELEFKKKNLLEIRKLKLEELNAYYRDFRKYEYEKDLPIKGIELRKKIHILIRIILKIDKIINRRTVKVIGDQRIKTARPKIYACTHIGRFDIESALEAFGENAWFIMGDPGETYRNLNGLILFLNGVSYFDMGDEFKFDAHTANIRQQKILFQGGNEFCFPEAAWNLDSLVPVGELDPGVVKRGIKTKSIIVPVGIEQYRGRLLKHYYVNIGQNIDCESFSLNDVDRLNNELRNKLMFLKLQIWEKYGQEKRSNLKENWKDAYDDFINSIMCDSENGYTIEEINRTKYKSGKLSPLKQEEIFAYFNDLIPSKENAFLLRKKM